MLEEGAVVPALDVVERRLLRLPVDGQHDALSARDHLGGAVQVDAGLLGGPVLPQLPGDRQADDVDAEMAVRREQPVRSCPPLGGVVVETDQQLSRSAGRLAGSMRNQYARARHQRRP